MSRKKAIATAPTETAIRSRMVGSPEDVDPRTLKANPLNFRQHPDEQRAVVNGSLRELGWLKPVLVNRTTGHIVDGHERVEDAIERGDSTVPVQYVELSDAEERLALAVLDPSSEMAVRDDEAVLRLLEEVATSDDGLQALLAQMAAEAGGEAPAAGGADEEDEEVDAPSEKATPITQRGDRIRLGRHVLFCGDSTANEDVDALLEKVRPDVVFTDPPYAIYGSSAGIAADITDDKMVRPFFLGIIRQAARVLKPFGHFYVCCDWRSYPSWWEVAKGTGLVPKNLIVWDKNGAGLGSNYANTHELIFFGSSMPMRQQMTQKIVGLKSVFDANVWRFNRVPNSKAEPRLHNAQKPVDMVRRALKNSSDLGGAVMDLFGGSGTTLIAAEEEDRSAYLMEIEPRWCDVIVDRWERKTGLKAERPTRTT
jgi:DNA modification methylase